MTGFIATLTFEQLAMALAYNGPDDHGEQFEMTGNRLRAHKGFEKNAKQRKLRYIKAKNLMRKYPDCAYGGDFYCDHLYEPEHPWHWVDFRFFHTRLKRYYAVAMTTARYKIYGLAEQQSWEDALVEYPVDPDRKPEDFESWLRRERTETEKARGAFEKARLQELLSQEWKTAPGYQLVDYGPVAIGVFATVNKEYIDEHVIREFIAQFREHGEPTKPGFIWKDEEIVVGPEELRAYRTEAS